MPLPSLAELMNRVMALPAEHRECYTRPRSQRHFRAVAKTLERQFHDADLTRAGLLHGLPSAVITEYLADSTTSAIAEIVWGREQLMAMDGENPSVATQLVSNVLPSLQDPRAVILLVIEQLHHVDPAEMLTDWTREARLGKDYLDEGMQEAPKSGWRFKSESAQTAFYRHVLATAAEYFGLWLERNVARNASLWVRDRVRFRELEKFAIEQLERGSVANELRQFVEELLCEIQSEVRWEWHQIEKLDTVLADSASSGWARQVPRLGFVNVTTQNVAGSYQALGALHAKVPYRRRVSDFLGESRLSGYQAVHTVLLPEELAGLDVESVEVRIMPQNVHAGRSLRADQALLRLIQERFSGDNLGFSVFTPDGQKIPLRAGATVLEFALALNSNFVALVRGATVNRRPVGLLHRLLPGDVVWLDIGDEPRPLPRGYDDDGLIPRCKRRKIEKALRRVYRPKLVTQGRAWFHAELQQFGVPADYRQSELDEQLAKATEALAAREKIHANKSAAWWLEQFGALDAATRGESLPFKRSASTRMARRIVKEAVGAIARAAAGGSVGDLIFALDDIVLSPERRGSVTEARGCGRCKPRIAAPAVGIEGQGVLTIHVPGQPCSDGGFPVAWNRHRPDCLLVDCEARAEVASDVIRVLEKSDAKLIDIAARRSSANQIVIRVVTDPLRGRVRENIADELARLGGVREIRTPSGDTPDVLERDLPRRPAGQQISAPAPLPYAVGPAIKHDDYFYGMKNSLETLRALLHRCENAHIPTSEFVFVSGPFKVGKTSLVRRFERVLDQTGSWGVLVWETVSGADETWSCCAAKLARRLRARLSPAPSGGAGVGTPSGSDELEELLEQARRVSNIPIVLVVDEAVRMFAANDTVPGETEKLERLRALMSRLGGILAIWVGPRAPVRSLSEESQSFLSHATSVMPDPLRVDEVKALLAAARLAPEHSINVPSAVARRVRKLTAGNPYWVQALGDAMFKTAKHQAGLTLTSRETVTYSPELVEKAMPVVLSDHRLFVKRICSQEPWGPSRGLERCVLDTVVELEDAGSRAGGRLDRDQLLERVERKLAGKSSRDELARVLADMEAVGSLALCDGGWGFAAPIIRQYVQNR